MSNTITKKILVCGSTGKQGGSVVRSLAAANSSLPTDKPNLYSILCLTRSAASASSQKLLALRGVSLLEGNLDDTPAIFAKAGANVHGVFAVQLPMGSGGVEGEVRQGKALADEAAKAGVKHYVQTTVERGGIEGKTGVPHFDSKLEIETYLRTTHSAMPTTILQPVYFMDNHADPSSFQGKIMSAMLQSTFSDPSKQLQMTACEDIGKIAGVVFQRPEEFIGKTISIASDSVTVPDAVATYKRVFDGADIPTTFGFFPPLIKALSKDMRTMFKFFDNPGYTVEIPTLQAQFPEIKLTTWEAYLQQRKVAGAK